MPQIVHPQEPSVLNYFRNHSISYAVKKNGIQVRKKRMIFAKLFPEGDPIKPSKIRIEGFGWPLKVMQLAHDLEARFECPVEVTFKANKPISK